MLVFVELGAGAVFQQNLAPQPQLGGNRHRLARVVGLRRALRDDGVGIFRQRVGHQKFELAGLVATGAQTGTVVTLDV